MALIDIKHLHTSDTIRKLVEATLLRLPETEEKDILREVLLWLGGPVQEFGAIASTVAGVSSASRFKHEPSAPWELGRLDA